MQVVVRSAAGEREVDVDIRNPDATVADLLLSAVDEKVPSEVTIGDRTVPSSCPLSEAGLHAGAAVSLVPSGETRPSSQSGFELAVVAGLDAGVSFPLAVGRSVIGRGQAADVTLSHATVSRQHCAVDVGAGGAITVTDLGSQNATVVDGRLLGHEERIEAKAESVIEVGAVSLELRHVNDDDRPKGLDLRAHVGPGGTIPFNRPPRPARFAAPSPLEIPKPPTESSKIPFSIAAVVGPLVLAVVMVQAYGPNYALFALLSPVIAVGSWLESRHRNKRKGGKDRLSYEGQLEKLRQSAEGSASAERARLRQLCPDPAEVLRRAALPSVRVWERRNFHDDFLQLSAGLAKRSWRPPVKDHHSDLAPEVEEILEGGSLEAAPVCVDLAEGGVVGIVGDRAASLALARNLVCQAATHHGPADLTIGVFVDPGRGPDWEWTKWLPHTRNTGAGAGARWLSERRESSDPLLRALAAGAGNGTVLVVLDSDVLTEGTNAPARTLLQPQHKRSTSHDRKDVLPVAGIVLAPTADRLPAACNTVIELMGEDGDGAVHRPEEGMHVKDVLVGGLSVEAARRCARDLARFEDPELVVAGSGLPDGARLLPLLGLDRIDAESIRKRWRQNSTATIAAPLGVTEDGVFVLDLECDGPHGLIAGTTGSGKSELLRSLVAGLAAQTDPNHLTFVLVDYKGGAAFDECSRLPHTVGMVTDLDEQLGERALRALEAELHYRERLLREARADNLRDYLAKGAPVPLPRLVVIIDEFATMAAELPDFISSLVGIAQRGRTLGVHMILATQRPSGAVNDNIRANTNLRIALRVQDAADSADVIGSRDAAELSRNRPGRAFVRLGPEETVPIQTALVTCVTDEQEDAAVDVAPFLFGPTVRAPESEQPSSKVPTRSDLARLVDAIVAANEAEGFSPPRRPWPEPLPALVDLAAVVDAQSGEAPEIALVALADDPAGQQQYPVGWDLTQGNLLLFGIPGSGLTSTLLGCALSLASKRSPEELEIYALDFGVGELKVLEGLPHTGSIILPGDRERQMRFVRYLRTELARRRDTSGPHIRTLVLVDNFSAMRAEFGDIVGLELMDQFTRVFADGPEVNISLAMTADRVNAIPGSLAALTPQKWLYRLAESSDYSSVGLGRKDVPRPTPGRAVMVENKQQIQVGTPARSWAETIATIATRHTAGTHRAAPIDVLPSHVLLEELGTVAQLGAEPWLIPIGLRESDLTAATLTLYEGEHVTVAGPARSGKSTTLWTIAESVKRAEPAARVFAAGGRRSPLRDCPALDRFAGSPGEANALIAQIRIAGAGEPVVLLLDDASTFDDLDGAIAALLGAALPHVHVVAAGSNDVLRGLYGHWTQTVRRSKVGVLLRPNIDLDGDLLGVTLPRRSPVPLNVGRGYLVQNGEYDILQVAAGPSDHPL